MQQAFQPHTPAEPQASVPQTSMGLSETAERKPVFSVHALNKEKERSEYALSPEEEKERERFRSSYSVANELMNQSGVNKNNSLAEYYFPVSVQKIAQAVLSTIDPVKNFADGLPDMIQRGDNDHFKAGFYPLRGARKFDLKTNTYRLIELCTQCTLPTKLVDSEQKKLVQQIHTELGRLPKFLALAANYSWEEIAQPTLNGKENFYLPILAKLGECHAEISGILGHKRLAFKAGKKSFSDLTSPLKYWVPEAIYGTCLTVTSLACWSSSSMEFDQKHCFIKHTDLWTDKVTQLPCPAPIISSTILESVILGTVIAGMAHIGYKYYADNFEIKELNPDNAANIKSVWKNSYEKIEAACEKTQCKTKW